MNAVFQRIFLKVYVFLLLLDLDWHWGFPLSVLIYRAWFWDFDLFYNNISIFLLWFSFISRITSRISFSWFICVLLALIHFFIYKRFFLFFRNSLSGTSSIWNPLEPNSSTTVLFWGYLPTMFSYISSLFVLRFPYLVDQNWSTQFWSGLLQWEPFSVAVSGGQAA